MAAFVYPYIVRAILGLPLPVRGIAAVLMVAPLGLLMGMPFPDGLRRLADVSKHGVPWMWGVNGAASVFGSVLAIAVAIASSFTVVLCSAALAYMIAAFVLPKAPAIIRDSNQF